MRIVAHKIWGCVILKLLIALSFQTFSVLSHADAASDWVSKSCSNCHGTDPANPGPADIDLGKFTQATMTTFIITDMPPATPNDCVGTCASDMAAYLFSLANQAPVASTSGSTNLSGSIPLTSNFNGNSSTDDNGIVSYAWNFGDGTSGTGATPSHTYTSVGTYNVTLTVTDAGGLSNTSPVLQVQANAVGAPPVANIHELDFLEDQIPVGLSFDPFDSSCPEQPCNYHWDFDDGTVLTSSGTQVGHTYETPGTYTIVLTVTDNRGRSDTDTMTVEVLIAETHAEYMEDCKAALNFDDDDIPNDLNCATGHLFELGSSPINDFVDYRQVTAEVDLVFACRWLQNGAAGTETFAPPFYFAESIEMLLHNRENGNTCFFKGNGREIINPDDGEVRAGVPVAVVSPTVAANALPGTPEADYWANPITLKRELPCAECHIAGPYIVTPRIAPFMQRFGLLNNGHDTYGRTFDSYGDTEGKYFAVGDTLGAFNEIIAENNVQTGTCADGCHSIGENGRATDIQRGFRGEKSGFQLLPSIVSVIEGSDPDISVTASGVMPPHDPIVGNPALSDYTWINRDNPFLEGSEGDSETFVEAQEEYSTLLSYCGNPGSLYAHIVDSDHILLPQPFSDQLSVFNAQDGVICLTSEQSDGQCNNFRVRYQCTDSAGNTSMTNWYNTDSPGGQGDFERRSDHANVCTGQTVTGIEASSTISTGWTGGIKGPFDRFAQFDRYGLVCKNSDQNDGQCDNYVVKFVSCSEAPEAYTARLRSAWSGRVLTASDTYNNALTKAQPSNNSWNSQDWVVEPVPGTGNVRLRNMWTGTYLNSQSDAEFTDIVVYDYVEEWGSQQWIVENVSGSSDIRLKNVWTGKYLTVNSAGDYADIKSQALNPSWPSQRWQIN